MFKKKYRFLILLISLFTIGTSLCAFANEFEHQNSKNNGIYIDEKITTPITKIGSPKIQKSKTKSLDFNSPNFAEDLKVYLTNNAEFPESDILQFSFFYNKTGTVAYIHLISISGKDYYDGNDYYATRVYGDTCMQDGLAENQVYVSDNSMNPELKAYPASDTVDGEYLLKIYDIIKNMGKSHIIQVPVENLLNFPQSEECITKASGIFISKLKETL